MEVSRMFSVPIFYLPALVAGAQTIGLLGLLVVVTVALILEAADR